MQQVKTPQAINNQCPTTPLRRAYLTGQSTRSYDGPGECRPMCNDCILYYYASCIREVKIFSLIPVD